MHCSEWGGRSAGGNIYGSKINLQVIHRGLEQKKVFS